MRLIPSCFHPAPLALAVALALAAPGSAYAQAADASRAVTLSIASQPLGAALNELSAATGTAIGFSPALVAGKTAAAVRGELTVRQAVERMLAGSGLVAMEEGGGIVIKAVVSDGVAALAPVTVTASGLRDGVTEGTGSYTTDVTSAATKMNLSIRETPQSISVVTRQRMDDQDLTSITKVLEQAPGVTVSRDTGERLMIYSRGNEISKYQYDGLTTHVENGTQNLTQTFADMSIYDRIEVVRGATGLMTGAGVPSGVVNMVRKKPTKEFQASLSGSVGRWDDYRSQVDLSGPLISSGKLRARFVGAKQDNDTFTEGYNQRRDVLYGVMEADITSTTALRLGVDYQKYDVNGGIGVPSMYGDGEQTDFSRSTTAVSKYQNENIATTNYFLNIDQELGNDWKLVVAGNYMYAERENSNALKMKANIGRTVDRATGEYLAERSDSFDAEQNQKSVAINLQGPFTLFGREHQAIFGFELSRYENDHTSYGVIASGTSSLSDPSSMKNETISMPDRGIPFMNQTFSIIQRGYYGALRLNPIEDLHLIMGARVSDYQYDTVFAVPRLNTRGTISYKESGVITPYAGLVYDLTPQQSVYASYTDIFTPNNVQDINGKVIDPEVGANYELGWKGEFYNGRLNANVAIYQIKRSNIAELAGYHSPDIAYYRAVDGDKTKGVDIEISGEVLPGWNVSASYSHSKSKGADGARRHKEHPMDTVKLWSTYNFTGGLHGLTIGGGARWISKTSTDYVKLNSQVIQGDYVLLDLMARYKFNKNLSATLNVSNVFDKKYYAAIGDLGYAYYGAPRNVHLNMRYEF